MAYTYTVKIASNQGMATRGLKVRVKGTDVLGEVSHEDEVGAYLKGEDKVYDPASLEIIGD